MAAMKIELINSVLMDISLYSSLNPAMNCRASIYHPYGTKLNNTPELALIGKVSIEVEAFE